MYHNRRRFPLYGRRLVTIRHSSSEDLAQPDTFRATSSIAMPVVVDWTGVEA